MATSSSPVPAGLRRHTVVLQNPSAPAPDVDHDGGYTQTWSDLATVRASIVPATARALERVAAGTTVIASASSIVTVPFVAGVSTKTRVVFNDRILSVIGVSNPDERSRELVLVCSEIVE